MANMIERLLFLKVIKRGDPPRSLIYGLKGIYKLFTLSNGDNFL
jgi:hypothetical protein